MFFGIKCRLFYSVDQTAQLVEKKKYLLMSFSQYIDAEEKNVEAMKR